ncbi:uncharacterized protein LOC110986943 isoform X2 [Acanthaster planci]|uniref:Uncharacterized protein LOC110986943 isoform X2 n=1 Tax=Acanthaster planci TaxID=133434 RepID=A0A8B7ZHC4_ACAPL|nr:uncharacterized protein LOC110986943 isoform X2 [Acanthaster planci]
MAFYPQVETYTKDTAYLLEMLGLFKQECLDYLERQPDFPEGYDVAKGWSRALDDGRACVTQFPHGRASTAGFLLGQAFHDIRVGQQSELPSKELHFVGFFGEKPAGVKQEMVDLVTKVNDSLMVQLSSHPDILLYGSAEVIEREGDFYNLVVMRNEAAGQHWKGGSLHINEAVNNLSPKYYTTVRIHTGVLPDGLDSKEFLLKRSVFLDYRAHQKDPNAPIQREVKLWENLPASSVEGDDRNQ